MDSQGRSASVPPQRRSLFSRFTKRSPSSPAAAEGAIPQGQGSSGAQGSQRPPARGKNAQTADLQSLKQSLDATVAAREAAERALADAARHAPASAVASSAAAAKRSTSPGSSFNKQKGSKDAIAGATNQRKASTMHRPSITDSSSLLQAALADAATYQDDEGGGGATGAADQGEDGPTPTGMNAADTGDSSFGRPPSTNALDDAVSDAGSNERQRAMAAALAVLNGTGLAPPTTGSAKPSVVSLTSSGDASGGSAGLEAFDQAKKAEYDEDYRTRQNNSRVNARRPSVGSIHSVHSLNSVHSVESNLSLTQALNANRAARLAASSSPQGGKRRRSLTLTEKIATALGFSGGDQPEQGAECRAPISTLFGFTGEQERRRSILDVVRGRSMNSQQDSSPMSLRPGASITSMKSITSAVNAESKRVPGRSSSLMLTIRSAAQARRGSMKQSDGNARGELTTALLGPAAMKAADKAAERASAQAARRRGRKSFVAKDEDSFKRGAAAASEEKPRRALLAMTQGGWFEQNLIASSNTDDMTHAFLLKHVPMLEELGSDRAKRLATSAFEQLEYKSGGVVLDYGADLDSAYVVRRGTFATYARIVGEGRTPLCIYTEGMLIGERALRYDGPSQVCVRCIEGGEVLRLLGSDFREIKESAHDVAASLTEGEDVPSFLRALTCNKGTADDSLRRLAEEITAHVCDSSASVMGVFGGAQKKNGKASGSDAAEPPMAAAIIRAGNITLKLPKGPDEVKHPGGDQSETREIDFVAGDVLGPVALRLMREAMEAEAKGAKRAWKSSRKLGVLSIATSAAFAPPSSPASASNSLPAGMRREAERCLARKVLQRIEAFRPLGAAFKLDAIVEAARFIRFEAGSRIIREGPGAVDGVRPGGSFSENGEMFVVLGGVARASRANMRTSNAKHDLPDGEQVGETVGFFASGDHFGAISIIEPSAARKVSVAASTPLDCLVITRETLGPYLTEIRSYLLRELAHRRWVLENRGQVSMKDLEFGMTIGAGTFGRVRLVKATGGDTCFALKCLDKSSIAAHSQIEHVASERRILAMCNHPFLLKLIGAFQDTDRLYLLLELIPGGELLALLRKMGRFNTEQARFYAANVVSAFAYLNSLSIVYRDLKPENLLLDSGGYLKVVDLGFAKMIDGRSYTFCGTPDYMAPEIIMNQPHTMACDWWSLGIFLYEMMVGTAPFTSRTPSAILVAILQYAKDRKLVFPWFFSSPAGDLIRRLLQPDVELRLGPEQVRRHPFFESIDFMALEARKVPAPYLPAAETEESLRMAAEFEPVEEDGLDDDSSEEYDPEVAYAIAAIPFAGFTREDGTGGRESEVFDDGNGSSFNSKHDSKTSSTDGGCRAA